MQIEIDDELALNILDHARAIGNTHGTVGPLLNAIAASIDPLDALAAQPGWYRPELSTKQVWFTSADYRSSIRVFPTTRYDEGVCINAVLNLRYLTVLDAIEIAGDLAAFVQPKVDSPPIQQ